MKLEQANRDGKDKAEGAIVASVVDGIVLGAYKHNILN